MENTTTKTDDSQDRILEIWKEISLMERHFNEIETKYRLLASQWLLGTFAGIGYILTAKDLEMNRWLVTGIISFLASIGIFQLWRMDLTIHLP